MDFMDLHRMFVDLFRNFDVFFIDVLKQIIEIHRQLMNIRLESLKIYENELKSMEKLWRSKENQRKVIEIYGNPREYHEIIARTFYVSKMLRKNYFEKTDIFLNSENVFLKAL